MPASCHQTGRNHRFGVQILVLSIIWHFPHHKLCLTPPLPSWMYLVIQACICMPLLPTGRLDIQVHQTNRIQWPSLMDREAELDILYNAGGCQA